MELKNKYSIAAGLTATALSLGLMGATTIGTAFADTAPSGTQPQDTKPEHREMTKNVQKSVQNLDNGVTISITSTDATTVTELQNRPQLKPRESNVTFTQTNLPNGIQVTMTSTDAATVTDIQTRAKDDHPFARKGGDLKGMLEKNVQRTVENITNGVNISLTSSDAATVTKLQARKAPTRKNDTVSVTQSNLSNGIQISITATDPAKVSKIQEREAHPRMPKGHRGHGKRGAPGQQA